MTRRSVAVLAALITSALCALSLGNALYLYIGLLLCAVLLYGFASCFWARRTAFCRQALSSGSVARGDEAHLNVQAGHRCPLPVAPSRGIFSYNGVTGDCVFSPSPFRTHERQ